MDTWQNVCGFTLICLQNLTHMTRLHVTQPKKEAEQYRVIGKWSDRGGLKRVIEESPNCCREGYGY